MAQSSNSCGGVSVLTQTGEACDGLKKLAILSMNGMNEAQNDLCKGILGRCNIQMFVAGLKGIRCFKKLNDKFQLDHYFDSDGFLGLSMNPLKKYTPMSVLGSTTLMQLV